LIKGLLNTDPKLRISAVDAISHAWFKTKTDGAATEFDPEVLKRLSAF